MRVWLVASLVCLGALAFSISTYTVFNDHFDRISRARQIVRYGALPFRDFFDPGYLMTEFSSAGLQLLLGDSLLGEMLLNTVFIASGVAVVFLLARRISNSILVGLGAALLGLLSMPRAYDFDKVLFYPLGIALCWHYIDRPSARRVVALGAGIAIGALFRYDTGVYIGCGAVVAAIVLHWREPGVLARRMGLCAATAALLWLAVLLPIVGFDNIGDAIDQIATYAVREKARTEISRAPRFSLGDLAGRVSPARAAIAIAVRWSPTIDDADRLEAESRYGLHAMSDGDAPDDNTRHYTMSDPSPAVIRELLRDPHVDDTASLERARQSLPSEPLWVRAQRRLPFLQWRVFPGAWTASNATAFIYYVLWGLPFAGVIGAVSAWRSPWLTTQEVARLGTVVIVCVAVNLFVLRVPVGARIGGIVGPAAILAAWIGARTWRTSPLQLRAGLLGTLLAVTALAVVSIGTLTSWSERLVPAIVSPSSVRAVIGLVSASPPTPELVSSPAFVRMVQYLRECTSPKDRVLARWFVPELYFFAQRGFAAGMVTTFGGHWSESRFETRSVQALASESVPIVIAREGDDKLASDYPALNRYIGEHYEVAGQMPNSDGYVVLIRNDRAPARTHPPTGLPCFD